jgi:hypothetical protein
MNINRSTVVKKNDIHQIKPDLISMQSVGLGTGITGGLV